MSRNPVDIDPAASLDLVEAVTLPDGEVIVALSADVAVRGTPTEILHWSTKVSRMAAGHLASEDVMTFARSMLVDMTAEMFKGDIPDELPPL